MSSIRIWSGITKTLLTLGVTMLVIGIVLLTIPGNIFTIGVFFLVAGAIGVIIYLLFTIIMCFSKRSSLQTENTHSTSQGRQHQENDQESNFAGFSVPAYEDVADLRYLHPQTEIWTVGMAAGQMHPSAELGDLPPYSSLDLEAESDATFTSASIRRSRLTDQNSTASVSPTHNQSSAPGTHSSITPVPKPMMGHQLRRISSDIHEVSVFDDLPIHMEPLTPPPAYIDILENPLAEAQFQAMQ